MSYVLDTSSHLPHSAGLTAPVCYSPWQIQARARQKKTRTLPLSLRSNTAPPFLRLVRDASEERPIAASTSSPPPRAADQNKSADNSAQTSARPAAPPLPAHDPRWVLAIQASRALQGTLLAQQDRDRLMRWGQHWGLTAFSCSLILAIVQDQARRGLTPELCPAAGLLQLNMVPPPEQAARKQRRGHRFLQTWFLVGLLAVECLLVFWWLTTPATGAS